MVLLVLDGWGWRPETDGNAIAMARTPAWDRLLATSPRTLLDASGLAVGLPEGQMGNSEVGHLNLGAGRVVPQDLVRINQSIERGDFFALARARGSRRQAKRTGGTVHLIGLLGAGGVHAMDAPPAGGDRRRWCGSTCPRIAIHGFLDGRDSPPKSAADVVAAARARSSRASAAAAP